MINKGCEAGYWVVSWADGFDPSLDDLVGPAKRTQAA